MKSESAGKLDLLKLEYPFKVSVDSKVGEGCGIIHIVSLNVWPRDAVSNHSIEMGLFFRHCGYEVRMYGEGVAAPYVPFVENRTKLEATFNSENDILIYQYSIEDNFLDVVLGISGKKIVYYHGITPPKLLEKIDPKTALACKNGLARLEALSAFDIIVANSEFNMTELTSAFRESGQIFAGKKFVLPPFLSLSRLPSIARSSGCLNLLYVGRLFPHKNVECVIDFFQALRAEGVVSTLTIAGSGNLASYKKTLMEHIAQIGEPAIGSAIFFEENLPDERLTKLFQENGVVVQLSRHEGFGMPLIEALRTNCLVISHDVGALKEALHGAGVLINSENLPGSSKIVSKIFRNPENVRQLLEEQKTVYEVYYSDRAVQNLYLTLLSALSASELKTKIV